MSLPITISIPAAVNGSPGVFVLASGTKYFKAIALDGFYRVRYGHGEIEVNNIGDGFGSPESPVYPVLEIRNSSAAVVTTTIYAGLEPSNISSTSVSNTLNTTAIIGNDESVPSQFAVNNATAGGTSKAISGAQLFVAWAMLVAVKDESRTANAGAVYVGHSATAGKQPFPMNPGEEFMFPIRAGKKLDLAKIFFSVDNAGDGLVILYLPA